MLEIHFNQPSIKHHLFKLSKKLKRIAIKSYKVTKGTTLFLIGPVKEYKRQKRKKATELARNEELRRSFIEDGNMYNGENNPSGQETIDVETNRGRIIKTRRKQIRKSDEKRRSRGMRLEVHRNEVGESSRAVQLPEAVRRYRASHLPCVGNCGPPGSTRCNYGAFCETRVSPESRGLGAGRFWEANGTSKSSKHPRSGKL
jgi:hypothetical protein